MKDSDYMAAAVVQWFAIITGAIFLADDLARWIW